MGNGRELTSVDELLLTAIVDFVISGQELLQLRLDVVVAERGSSGTSFTLFGHLSSLIKIFKVSIIILMSVIRVNDTNCFFSVFIIESLGLLFKIKALKTFKYKQINFSRTKI